MKKDELIAFIRQFAQQVKMSAQNMRSIQYSYDEKYLERDFDNLIQKCNEVIQKFKK